MAGSQKDDLEISDLLPEVIAVRRAATKEYEWKLKNYCRHRVKQMKDGIFDGVKLPEVKCQSNKLDENIEENRKIAEKIQMISDQYFYAKEASHQLNFNGELKRAAEALKKTMEIERTFHEQ